MRALGLTLGAVLMAAPVAPGQRESLSRVPIAPGAVCDALRGSYVGRDVEERIVVSVTKGGVTRSEPLTMRVWGGAAGGWRAFELELGPLVVWSEGGELRAVHGQNEAAYFAEPIGEEGALAAIGRAMPPIPAPPLWFALGEGRGCPEDLAYATGVRWVECEVDAEARPSVAWLEGEGEGGVRVELHAELEPPRLTGFEIVLEEEGVRIEGRVSRGPAPEEVGLGIEGRRRVATVAELAPMAGVIRGGDVLAPPLMVLPADGTTPGVTSTLEPVRGPAVVVLFSEWNRDVSRALALAREAVEGFEEYRVMPVAVLDLGEGEGTARQRVERFAELVEPLDLWFSVDPEGTLERVNPYARVALIVVDERQVVRMSERIDKFTVLDEPGVMSARILAAITRR